MSTDNPNKLEKSARTTEKMTTEMFLAQCSSLSIKHAGGSRLSWNGRRMTILTHRPFIRLHHFTYSGTQTLEVVVHNTCATDT